METKSSKIKIQNTEFQTCPNINKLLNHINKRFTSEVYTRKLVWPSKYHQEILGCFYPTARRNGKWYISVYSCTYMCFNQPRDPTLENSSKGIAIRAADLC